VSVRSSITGRYLAVKEALLHPETTVTEKPVLYPHLDGETVVIGPQCFADLSEDVINWRGVNYRREPDDDAAA
jgi:hypothetical protein